MAITMMNNQVAFFAVTLQQPANPQTNPPTFTTVPIPATDVFTVTSSAPASLAAIWGAELAAGDGPQRIYVVEPIGTIVDDPNLTDKKFPGNPTLSYRSREPLRVVGEVTNWKGHSPDQLRQMREGLERLRMEGAEIID